MRPWPTRPRTRAARAAAAVSVRGAGTPGADRTARTRPCAWPRTWSRTVWTERADRQDHELRARVPHVDDVEGGGAGLEPDVGVTQQREHHPRRRRGRPSACWRCAWAYSVSTLRSGESTRITSAPRSASSPRAVLRGSRRWCRRCGGHAGSVESSGGHRGHGAVSSASSHRVGANVWSSPHPLASRPLPVEEPGAARPLLAVVAHHLTGRREVTAERVGRLEADGADELGGRCQIQWCGPRPRGGRTPRPGAGSRRRGRRWLRRSPSTTGR